MIPGGASGSESRVAEDVEAFEEDGKGDGELDGGTRFLLVLVFVHGN